MISMTLPPKVLKNLTRHQYSEVKSGCFVVYFSALWALFLGVMTWAESAYLFSVAMTFFWLGILLREYRYARYESMSALIKRQLELTPLYMLDESGSVSPIVFDGLGRKPVDPKRAVEEAQRILKDHGKK